MLLGLQVDGRPRLLAATLHRSDGHSRVVLSSSTANCDGGAAKEVHLTLRPWTQCSIDQVKVAKSIPGASTFLILPRGAAAVPFHLAATRAQAHVRRLHVEDHTVPRLKKQRAQAWL